MSAKQRKTSSKDPLKPATFTKENGLTYSEEDAFDMQRLIKSAVLTAFTVAVLTYVSYTLFKTVIKVYDGERSVMDALIWDLLPLVIESIAAYYMVVFSNKILLLNDDKFNTPEELKKYE